eukprot:tig00020849_g14659.t1
MPPAIASQHDSIVRRYLHTGQARLLGTLREEVGRRKSGEEFPVELSISEMRINGEVFFVGMRLKQNNFEGAPLPNVTVRRAAPLPLPGAMPGGGATRRGSVLRRAIADRIENVSVMFADIVNFTPLAGSMDAAHLVALLNDIFSEFDSLAEKYKLEKIKTLGDAFMCAGGVPVDACDSDEPHLVRMAKMALEMHEAIDAYRAFDGRPFRIRIGIHVGTVIAGVIGKKKYLYDLWGDTVNIASRMESSGLPGRTQVSRAVYEELAKHEGAKSQFRFEDRGEVFIKGKGHMHTYFLMDPDEVSPEMDEEERQAVEALEKAEAEEEAASSRGTRRTVSEATIDLGGGGAVSPAPIQSPVPMMSPSVGGAAAGTSRLAPSGLSALVDSLRESGGGGGGGAILPNSPSGGGGGGGGVALSRPPRSRSLASISFKGGPPLESHEFSVAHVPHAAYPLLVQRMLARMGLLEACRPGAAELSAFVREALASYRPSSPFHNAAHALDVCQMVFFQLLSLRSATPQPPQDELALSPAAPPPRAGGFRRVPPLDHIDMYAILVAALCHDLDHPGLTNLFLIKSKAPMAVLYCNSSPLERHHASRFLSLLQREDVDILVGLSPEERQRFSQLAVDVIMATDMMLHGDYMAAFKARFLDDEPARSVALGAPGARLAHLDDRTLFAAMLMKCADLANGARTFENSQHWSSAIQQEFFAQGALEQELGLEVSPGMSPTNEPDMGSSGRQVFFLSGVILPLYEAVAELVPEVGSPLVASIRSNIERWREVHQSMVALV